MRRSIKIYFDTFTDLMTKPLPIVAKKDLSE